MVSIPPVHIDRLCQAHRYRGGDNNQPDPSTDVTVCMSEEEIQLSEEATVLNYRKIKLKPTNPTTHYFQMV